MKFINVKITFVGIVLFISCLFNVANAEIIDTTNDSFIDINTDLEWMDFGVNNHLTYDEVISLLGEGGLYEEWSLATAEQVYTMMANTFLGLDVDEEDPDYNGPGQLWVSVGKGSLETTPIELIYEMMGHNVVGWEGLKYEHIRSMGLFQGVNGLARVDLSSQVHDYARMTYTDFAYIEDSFSYSENHPEYGPQFSTMLVRTSSIDVPEPTTLAIFGIGLMGLLGMRCFKKQPINRNLVV